MLKFMLSDLRFHFRLWLPAFVSAGLGAACAGGVIIAVSSGLHTAEPAPVNDALEGVQGSVGGTVSLLYADCNVQSWSSDRPLASFSTVKRRTMRGGCSSGSPPNN